MDLEIAEFLNKLKKNRYFKELWVHHKYLPPTDSKYQNTEKELSPKLHHYLKDSGISNLYLHQARSIDLVRKKNDIVVVTPTASGKSLVYNIPVLESIEKYPRVNALYLFPFKALGQDQYQWLANTVGALGWLPQNTVAVYDGDTL